MQFPNWLKVLWWAILAIGLGLFLRERLPDLLSGNAAAADIAVFGIWMALLLAPLFSEVALLGVTLKNEIEELKGNVATQLTDLRADIRNAIDVKTTISQTFHQPSPPPDAQLPALEAQVKAAVAAAFAEQGKTATATAPLAVADDIALLFATRYHIEAELRRVAAGREIGVSNRRPAPVFLLSRSLVETGLLSPKLGNAIREVYSVCSPAIHGEEVSAAQVAFVRDVGPELISALRAIQ
jgi:hypothetical protein